MKKLIVALATFCLLNSGIAQASLVDRGGGLIFDTVLNITWLRDANYAKTSGHDADGKMSRSDSIAWAESLTYGGYDDWRLAGNLNNAHPFHYGWQTIGSDTTPMTGPSELSHMFYENLGLKGYFSNNGSWANNFGIHGDSTFGGQNNVGLIINLQGGEYLSNSAPEPYPYERPWTFETNAGNHYMRGLYEPFFAWAVRDGDVAATISEPETYAMLLAGLGLLGFSLRRKKQSS